MRDVSKQWSRPEAWTVFPATQGGVRRVSGLNARQFVLLVCQRGLVREDLHYVRTVPCHEAQCGRASSDSLVATLVIFRARKLTIYGYPVCSRYTVIRTSRRNCALLVCRPCRWRKGCRSTGGVVSAS